MVNPLHVRVDATPAVGAGHAMRCAAFAERWASRTGGRVSLHGELTIPFVRARLEPLPVELAAGPARPPVGAILVVDSYDAGVRAWGARQTGCALRVLVDDMGEPVPAGYDMVWNPNAYGTPALYPGTPACFLGGEDAVPLRRGLPRWEGGEPGTVAVMLGGSRLARRLDGALDRVARLLPEVELRRIDTAGVPDPWEQVVRCERLLTASGTTVWESAAVGIPVAAVQIVDNQDRVAEWVRSCGAPVLDGRGDRDPDGLAAAMCAALPSARPLRPLRDGSANVADALLRMACAAAPGAG